MRPHLLVLTFFIFVFMLNACSAPTAIPPTAVQPPTNAPTANATASAPTAIPPTAVRTLAPTQTPPSTNQAAQTKPTAISGSGSKLNLNELIPLGDGRELVMENCMSCHSIAPVLVSQKTPGEWEGTKGNHRAAIAHLGDADFDKLFVYLNKNFGPDHKVPNLPPELLSGWTNY